MSGIDEARRGLTATVRTIETRTSVYTLHEDGIIVQKARNKTRQSMADAMENIAAFVELCGGKKHPCLVDGRAELTFEPGVREYYAGPEAAKFASALALLSDSGPMKVLANLFLTINKPTAPTRMFTKEDEALAWLRKIHQLTLQMGE